MPPSTRRPATALACAPLLALLAACTASDRPDAGAWAGTVDTLPDGRVLVRNASAPRVAWTLEERTRIGSLDAPGPTLFGQIAGLHLDEEGGVWVLDGQALEVRSFGADGTFLRAFGREGQGPGELSQAAGLAADGEGTLWVMNWGNARYTGFDPLTGAVRREARRALSFASFPWPGAFEGGSRLLDIGLDAGGEPAILRLDTLFLPTDTLALPRPADGDRIVWRRDGLTVASFVEPFAPQPAWAPRPAGGIVLGEGGAYRLHRIGFDGDTTMTIEVARERVAVSAAERDSALAVLGELSAMLGGATADRTPTPRAFKPAHGPLFVDDEDRTWVWADLPDGSGPVWDVFDAQGRLQGHVRVPVPPSFLRPHVRGGRLAVATQVRGFPEVVVYALVPVEGEG